MRIAIYLIIQITVLQKQNVVKNDILLSFLKERIHTTKKCRFGLTKGIWKSCQKPKFHCKSVLVQSIKVNNKVS